MAGPRILLVDDDDAYRHAVRSFLAHAGYQVSEACDGREAMELLPSVKPELIVLDLRMPRMDGFEVLEALEEPPNERIPVVAISAHASGAPPRATAFHSKDRDVTALIALVKQLVG